MSQRVSGYKRKKFDLYETPEWVTLALEGKLRPLKTVLEPASGSGKMAGALKKLGYTVLSADIRSGKNFLECEKIKADAIITNPPYNLATEFILHAIDLMRPNGLVAMLLRTDFDHAKTRAHLFSGSKIFSKKIVLTKRIVWFEKPGAAPSFNHAWFVWDWRHDGYPILSYDIQEKK